jgi:hypothetical protein
MTTDTKNPPQPQLWEDALRVRINQIIDEGSYTRAEVARALCYSKTAVSLWLTGKYSADGRQIAVAAYKWLKSIGELPDAARDQPLTTVETPAFRTVQFALNHALEQRTMTCVIGMPGVGKSHAILAWTKKAREEGLRFIQITANITQKTSPKAILVKIAEALQLPVRGSTAALMDSVLDRLRRDDHLLIVDEAQHLKLAPFEALRALHDQAGIGIAIIGSQALEHTLSVQPKFSELRQLQSRFGAIRYLGVLAGTDLHRFVDIVWGATVGLDVKARIKQETGGVPRDIVRLLTHARTICNGEALSVAHIEQAQKLVALHGQHNNHHRPEME